MRFVAHVHVGFLCVISLAAASCVGPPITTIPRAKEDPAAVLWLRSAQIPPSAFRVVPAFEKLASAVRGDSLYWSDRFFTRPAHPFTPRPELEIGAAPSKDNGPDLISYRYKVGPLALTVIESVNFTLVRVGGSGYLEANETRRPAIVAELAATLLRAKADQHDWVFVPAPRAGADDRYSTNANVDAWDLRSWEDRADAGVDSGALYFLLFKKNPERVGYGHAQRWFDDAFRKGLGFW